MAHTYALGQARTSSAASPISFSLTVSRGDTVLCLLLKVVGATDRAGGAPTLNGVAFTQASVAQKAATSPEAGAELWYLLNPLDQLLPGAYTLTIPNTGALTVFYTVAVGRAAAGGRSALEGASGGNATGNNPSPGAVTVTEAGGIGFAVVATGAQTWAPTAQAGTIIANTDDGAHGGGEQYVLNPALAPFTLDWTFGTSDDWGAVAAFFKEIGPQGFQNYLGVDAGDGVSTTEKIR